MQDTDKNIMIKKQCFEDYSKNDEENKISTIPLKSELNINPTKSNEEIPVLEENEQKIIVNLQTLLSKKEPSIFFNELLHKYPELTPKTETKETIINGRKNFHVLMEISKFKIESSGKGFLKSMAKSKFIF